jgi:hypothetical protein
VPFRKRDVATIDSDLVPIGRNLHKKLPDGFPKHEIFYGMLRYYAHKHNKNDGWAASLYRKKCNAYPPFHWNNMARIAPSKKVASWITGMNIRYAKGRAKAYGR